MIKHVTVISSLCVLVGCMIGCGDEVASPMPSGPAVLIRYQSEPLADVHVRLLASDGGPVLCHAITQSDGQATFVDLPSPEPEVYFVVLESVGDGGWMLNRQVLDRATKSLRLKPLAENPSQSIDLPRGSVQSL